MSNNHRDPYEMLLSEARLGWQYNMMMQKTYYNAVEILREREMLDKAKDFQHRSANSYRTACDWLRSYNNILIESRQGV